MLIYLYYVCGIFDLLLCFIYIEKPRKHILFQLTTLQSLLRKCITHHTLRSTIAYHIINGSFLWRWPKKTRTVNNLIIYKNLNLCTRICYVPQSIKKHYPISIRVNNKKKTYTISYKTTNVNKYHCEWLIKILYKWLFYCQHIIQIYDHFKFTRIYLHFIWYAWHFLTAEYYLLTKWKTIKWRVRLSRSVGNYFFLFIFVLFLQYLL